MLANRGPKPGPSSRHSATRGRGMCGWQLETQICGVLRRKRGKLTGGMQTAAMRSREVYAWQTMCCPELCGATTHRLGARGGLRVTRRHEAKTGARGGIGKPEPEMCGQRRRRGTGGACSAEVGIRRPGFCTDKAETGACGAHGLMRSRGRVFGKGRCITMETGLVETTQNQERVVGRRRRGDKGVWSAESDPNHGRGVYRGYDETGGMSSAEGDAEPGVFSSRRRHGTKGGWLAEGDANEGCGFDRG